MHKVFFESTRDASVSENQFSESEKQFFDQRMLIVQKRFIKKGGSLFSPLFWPESEPDFFFMPPAW